MFVSRGLLSFMVGASVIPIQFKVETGRRNVGFWPHPVEAARMRTLRLNLKTPKNPMASSEHKIRVKKNG